jgi:hypothetical protein
MKCCKYGPWDLIFFITCEWTQLVSVTLHKFVRAYQEQTLKLIGSSESYVGNKELQIWSTWIVSTTHYFLCN